MVTSAVGMEAHGYGGASISRLAEIGQKAVGVLPGGLARKVTDRATLDRLDALHPLLLQRANHRRSRPWMSWLTPA